MSQVTGSLTTTGATPATGILVLPKSPQDYLTTVSLYGTYGTVQAIIEASFDYITATNPATAHWESILAQDSTTAGSALTGTLTLTDNSTRNLVVPSIGTLAIRVRVVAIVSGALAVSIFSSPLGVFPFAIATANPGPGATVGLLTTSAMGTVQSSAPTAAQLLGGFVTQTGVTGAGVVTLPTGTLMSGAMATTPSIGTFFDFWFANLGGGQIGRRL